MGLTRPTEYSYCYIKLKFFHPYLTQQLLIRLLNQILSKLKIFFLPKKKFAAFNTWDDHNPNFLTAYFINHPHFNTRCLPVSPQRIFFSPNLFPLIRNWTRVTKWFYCMGTTKLLYISTPPPPPPTAFISFLLWWILNGNKAEAAMWRWTTWLQMMKASIHHHPLCLCFHPHPTPQLPPNPPFCLPLRLFLSSTLLCFNVSW